jgi:hypothetical protein
MKKKHILFLIFTVFVVICSCNVFQSLDADESIPVEVVMGSDATQGSKALGIGADENVLSIEIKVINNQGSRVGLGTLTKNGGQWSGTVGVSETGTLTFIGLAKDTLDPSNTSAKTLYLGNGTLTVSAGAMNSVVISTGTTGEAGTVLGMRGPAGGWIFFAKTQYDNTMPYFDYGEEGDYSRDGDGVLMPTYHDGVGTDAGFAWRFLEAAPASTEWMAEAPNGDPIGKQWGSRCTVTLAPNAPPSATGLGAGKANTSTIVEFHNSLEGDFYEPPYEEFCDGTVAAKFCANLSFSGFDDWYLPSLDETYLMSKNLPKGEQEPGWPISLAGFSSGDYWSSTEYAWDSAFIMRFDYWNYPNIGPYVQGKVATFNYTRAARSF